MRSHCILISALAVALRVAAFTLTPETFIAIPDDDHTGVSAAIEVAAHDLATNVFESTGLRLKVLTAGKIDKLRNAMAIGETFAVQAGLRTDDLKNFDNVIAEKDGVLYLFGHDRPCGKTNGKPLSWRNCVMASAKAVTEFEYNYMGVRYLAPGRVGVAVPRLEKIEVPDGVYKINRPYMEAGNGRFFSMMYCIANNILGHGAYKTFGGHLYPSAFPVKKYFSEHPEYYGLVGDDRSQSQEHNPVICISNPDVKRIIVEYMLKLYDEGADVIELGQNDGAEFCCCEGCRAYGGALADTNGEKFWIFHRSIAEELFKLRPEKTVQIIMYGATRQFPKSFTDFPPNVMIEMMSYEEKDFENWRKYKVPRGFSVYTYMWGEYPQLGLTCKVNCRQLAEIARRFVKNGVKSVYRCGYGELFGTEGPASYVFNQLLATPDRDVDDLVEEYLNAAYGSATRHMRKFHSLLDKRVAAWVQCCNFNGIQGGSWSSDPIDALAYVYTPAVVSSCERYLLAAEGTKGLSDKERKRIELVRKEFDYARSTGEICHLYNAFRVNGSRAAFDSLADKVLARNAMIDAMYDEKGDPRTLVGWNEIVPLGRFGKAMKIHNGRLGGTLQAPFTWDVALMRRNGVIPGGPPKETRVAAVLTSSPWNKMSGMQLDKCDYETRFRCAYDTDNFYLEVDAELPDDQSFRPQGHDGVCFRQECLELFIDPTFEKTKCFHFIWNPVENSCLDEAFGLCSDPLDPRFGQFNVDWNGRWHYRVERKGGRWRSLVTIPYATLGVRRPEVGDKWFFNLGRETYKPGNLQIQLWNPSMEGRGMRDLESLGTIVFE